MGDFRKLCTINPYVWTDLKKKENRGIIFIINIKFNTFYI